MSDLFQTFKPIDVTVSGYVDYYYLDLKPDNKVHEFQCFPHFNTTISLYKSHLRAEDQSIFFKAGAKPFQIFTPVRESVLHVKQVGALHRVVIVFNLLGVQQFFRLQDFADYITDFNFFEQDELKDLFSTVDTKVLTTLLDSFLIKKFEKFENAILETSITYIFKNYERFSVEEVSEKVGISRQHLNRIFQKHLGISVKKLYEIVLFRQTIRKKIFENPDRTFTELAHEFNFNDQSHFNKSYKNLTQNSPKSFFSKGTILGEEDTFWHLQ